MGTLTIKQEVGCAADNGLNAGGGGFVDSSTGFGPTSSNNASSGDMFNLQEELQNGITTTTSNNEGPV